MPLRSKLTSLGRGGHRVLRWRIRTEADLGRKIYSVLVRFSLKFLWEQPGEDVQVKSEAKGRSQAKQNK